MKLRDWKRPVCGRDRLLVDDPGRAAQAPGPPRGSLVLPVAARTRPAAPGARWTLRPIPTGLALGRRGPLSSLRPLAGRGGQFRSLVAEALAHGGSERLARRTSPDGGAPSPRWILCHMIEESTRGTTAMPTSSGNRWTASPASSRTTLRVRTPGCPQTTTAPFEQVVPGEVNYHVLCCSIDTEPRGASTARWTRQVVTHTPADTGGDVRERFHQD